MTRIISFSFIVIATMTLSVTNTFSQPNKTWIVSQVEPTEAILLTEQQSNFLTVAGWISSGVYLRVNDAINNPAWTEPWNSVKPNRIWAEYVQYSTYGLITRWGYLIYSRDGSLVSSFWPEYRSLTYYISKPL